MYRIGRLTMVKTTLLTMPIYTAISIHMPHWLEKALVRISKSFLWSGTDVVQGGKCLVAWSHVARPLDLGGLGVLDLNLMGRALQLRWLWLSRPDLSHTWAALLLHKDQHHPSVLQGFHSLHCG
jgi:hypothetical protein